LEPVDVSAELEGIESVLIVWCPICPPMSLAMQTGSPFLELFRRGLKTGAFEDYIAAIREPLEQRGVRVGVYRTYLPCPTMCLWTRGQRERLRRRAKAYDAVLVLGCDSATRTAKETVEESGCKVIQAMRSTGVANATVGFRFPSTVDLRHAAYVGSDEEDERPATRPPSCRDSSALEANQSGRQHTGAAGRQRQGAVRAGE
jgi:hypothetical protein